MPPIIQSTIRYRRNRKGFPQKCTISLYSKRLEIVSKAGVETILVSNIVRVGVGNNVMVLLLSDGRRISLYFESLRRRLIFRYLFGMIGTLLVRNVGESRQLVDMWAHNLVLQGVEVRRA